MQICFGELALFYYFTVHTNYSSPTNSISKQQLAQGTIGMYRGNTFLERVAPATTSQGLAIVDGLPEVK